MEHNHPTDSSDSPEIKTGGVYDTQHIKISFREGMVTSLEVTPENITLPELLMLLEQTKLGLAFSLHSQLQTIAAPGSAPPSEPERNVDDAVLGE